MYSAAALMLLVVSAVAGFMWASGGSEFPDRSLAMAIISLFLAIVGFVISHKTKEFS